MLTISVKPNLFNLIKKGNVNSIQKDANFYWKNKLFFHNAENEIIDFIPCCVLKCGSEFLQVSIENIEVIRGKCIGYKIKPDVYNIQFKVEKSYSLFKISMETLRGLELWKETSEKGRNE